MVKRKRGKTPINDCFKRLARVIITLLRSGGGPSFGGWRKSIAACSAASLAGSLSRYSGANLDPDLEVGSSRFAASRAASLASLILKETLFPHQLLLSPSSANPLKIHGKRQPYLAGFFWKYGFFWCHWDYSAIFSSILLLSIC